MKQFVRNVLCIVLTGATFIVPAYAAQMQIVGGNSAGKTFLGPPVITPTPNIILIVADDLGYGDLGCYGQKQIKTPNLDKLAAGGTRFTSFYAGSTVCAPSRCSLMTGFHTGHCTIRGNDGTALSAADTTIAQVLHGPYSTGLAGKWGLGDEGSTGLPGDKGFDQFVGVLNQTRAHDYYAPYVDRQDAAEGFRHVEYPQNANGAKGVYLPNIFQTFTTNFIRIRHPDLFNRREPFFLVVAQTLPHANNEEGRATGNGMQVPHDKPYSAETWPPPEKNKAAMITRLDHYVGEIMAKLQEYRQESNTLVLFTSDNGSHKEGGVDPNFFQSSGPLRGIKRDLYEGGIRVPLIASWPGKVPTGRVCDEPFAFWDILPTLAELAKRQAPDGIDGISYLPTLFGKSQTNLHEFFYWEFNEGGFKQAVRAGEWKGIRQAPGKALELYNLTRDIGETNNIAEENPQVVARMENILARARTEPLKPKSPKKAFPQSAGDK
ncbi:MAG: hypothetical protein RLY20_1827 [Verrucomicrobiota bacterium]|jgi:arylsulfatase A-like enzyme